MEVSPEQVGTAAVWFTSQAGIAATILAVVCLALACGLVWTVRACRKTVAEISAVFAQHTNELTEAWGKRIDQMRSDTKDAFGQNAKIADTVVAALHALQMEVARLSARRE